MSMVFLMFSDLSQGFEPGDILGVWRVSEIIYFRGGLLNYKFQKIKDVLLYTRISVWLMAWGLGGISEMTSFYLEAHLKS
jgi:hypothetical protein